jgi:hypothetical protein
MNQSTITIDRLDDYEREYDDITQKNNDICMYMFRFTVFLSFSLLLFFLLLLNLEEEETSDDGQKEAKN